MPYPRSPQRIVSLLPAIFSRPEIAAELEKKAIRRDVIERDTLERADRIWEAVSARVESYTLTEQTLATAKREGQLPSAPSYLRWTLRAWTFIVTILISGALFAVIGFIKGWHVPLHFITRFLTWRSWVFLITNLVVISGILFVWHRRRNRFFKKSLQSAEKERAARLAPLQQQLDAEKKLADESLDQAVLSEIREIIADKQTRRFGTSLPDCDPDGLSQVHNPEFEITTPAADRLRRTVTATSGASIGISGPRGAGKTTLLWSNYQIGNTSTNVLSVWLRLQLANG